MINLVWIYQCDSCKKIETFSEGNVDQHSDYLTGEREGWGQYGCLCSDCEKPEVEIPEYLNVDSFSPHNNIIGTGMSSTRYNGIEFVIDVRKNTLEIFSAGYHLLDINHWDHGVCLANKWIYDNDKGVK